MFLFTKKDEQSAWDKKYGAQKITASCLEYPTLAVTVIVWRTIVLY
ncbi:MAG: hypothetical protein WC292_07245 [Clostridia bacterium]